MFYGNVSMEKLHRKLKANSEYYAVEFYMDSHSFSAKLLKDGDVIRIMSTNELVKLIESDSDIGENI